MAANDETAAVRRTGMAGIEDRIADFWRTAESAPPSSPRWS